jgi:hypothetical protein
MLVGGCSHRRVCCRVGVSTMKPIQTAAMDIDAPEMEAATINLIRSSLKHKQSKTNHTSEHRSTKARERA